MEPSDGDRSESVSAQSDSPQAENKALGRILASSEFRFAKRLREFLSYVVAESLAGRGDLISGRTVAQDVYQRGQSESDSDLSVVRVDAGRLRRRLNEYYSGTGAEDAMRVTIPTGSYAPTFEEVAINQILQHSGPGGRESLGFRAAVVLALIGVVLVGAFLLVDTPSVKEGQASQPSKHSKPAMRRALLQKSPATLQAVNQAEQARGLMFPAPDPKRLILVLGMFEHVIELDRSYFGGYAGAAQVAATLGGLMPYGPQREAMLAKADSYCDMAQSLRPESSWVQSAKAWAAFSHRDFEKASALSRAALALDSNDLYAREFDTLIALFSGDFDRAVQMGNPETFANDITGRRSNRNAFAVAHFYLGNNEVTVDRLEEVIARGEPVSEISIFYLTAAHQKLGNHREARAFAEYYQIAWPNSRVGSVLKRVFISPEYLDEPMTLFKAAADSLSD